jgi:hypothetical protein
LTLLLMHGPSRSPALSAAGRELVSQWPAALELREVVLGENDADALGDPDGAMFKSWGVRAPEFALVRPDGHVAVRAPLDRIAALRAYAQRWLTAND